MAIRATVDRRAGRKPGSSSTHSFDLALGTVALVVPWAVPVTDALLRLVLGTIGVAAAWPVAQVETPWWLAGGLAGMCVWLVIHFVYASHQETLPRR